MGGAKNEMDRYAEIKKNLLHYAESDEAIRAVVAIGSSTRDTVLADDFILRELKICFAHYDTEDVKAALMHTHQLFAKLARAVAEKLDYEYPDQAEKCAGSFLNS